MSFEGYYQVLCQSGHYNTFDCYMDEPEDYACACGDELVWWNLVDITNGCEATHGDPHDLSDVHEVAGDCICGYIPLEQTSQEVCDKCQSVLDQRFKLPTKGGHKIKKKGKTK